MSRQYEHYQEKHEAMSAVFSRAQAEAAYQVAADEMAKHGIPWTRAVAIAEKVYKRLFYGETPSER